tara:strand:+ start:217 stop:774 length:558 start_codon:yes stop_codon:yes gene_type:complete
MKTIITMILMMAVSLSQGVVYMDLGLVPSVETEIEAGVLSASSSDDLETGSVSIGYYHPVYQISDKMGLFVGGSYEVTPAKDGDTEFGFMVFYGSVGYSLSDQLSAWGSLGMSMPTSDYLKDSDAENGIHMGMGVTYSVNEQIGVALGYVVNSTSNSNIDMGDGILGDWDWNVSKLVLSLGCRLL